MSCKHTPGPWHQESGKGELRITGPNGETIVDGCGCCGSPYGENLLHDAPLLAAAPSLLLALEMLLEWHTSIVPEDEEYSAVREARAVIKKATAS